MIRLRYVIHFRDDVDPAGLATGFPGSRMGIDAN